MKVIILAGGAGTRLWPLSRGYFPKQFIQLNGMDKSILQMTIDRCMKLVDFGDIVIVTNKEYKFLICWQLEEMGLQPIEDNILAEPLPRNTLPAIYNGVKHIRKGGEETVAVFPSDHLIYDNEGFCKAMKKGEELAQSCIVAFGIKATSPETGYGYIQPGRDLGSGHEVLAFHEKPELQLAKQYMQQKYMWNAGMFMFRTDIFVQEVQKYSPAVYEAFRHKTPEECFRESPSISMDYGVMEHSKRAAVVLMENDWSDLGSFQSIYEAYKGMRDEDGNVGGDNSIIVDSRNSMVLGDSHKPIALVGMDDTVVIEYPDATLVCRMDKSQQVKVVVDQLKQRSEKSLDIHSTQQRQWGTATTLEDSSNYRVKRLTVNPYKGIPTRNSPGCAKQWTVAAGQATASIDGNVIVLGVGESISINSGLAHSLHNPDGNKLIVIEVQTGQLPDDLEKFTK